MELTITNVSAKAYSAIGHRTMIEATCGKHSATVDVARKADTGEIYQVWVIVHNAANRCWRGMGKQFTSVQNALDRYKTPEIKTIIETASQMQAPCEKV